MFKVQLCPECGVPRYITGEHRWMPDGSIVQASDPGNRVAFIETENFDPLYTGIGELIGVPIEHILTDASRRSTYGYMSKLVSPEAAEAVRSGAVDLELVFETMFEVARIMGYGNPSLVDVSYEHANDDYLVVRYVNPCSSPLIAGTIAGTVEAYDGRACGVTYVEPVSGTIDVTVRQSHYREELKDRLWLRPYSPGHGDVELERCDTCGGPTVLARYEWDTGRGVIRSKSTGRRMALVGPPMIDAVFEELEAELGETIPEVVVEAQRRFVRNGLYSYSEIQGGEKWLREQFARRGLGYIDEMKMSPSRMSLRLANATLCTMLVGLVQGLFELAYGVESRAEWQLDERRLLEVEVVPWKE